MQVCHKLIGFWMHTIDTILETTASIWISLDFCYVIENVCYLAVTCMYGSKSLGFCCSSILELEILWISSGNVCSLRTVGCAWLGMMILAKNTAPKCFPHNGLLLHQNQQLFPHSAISCSTVLCQFSLLSLRRMHTGELIHQPSDKLCSN